LGSETSSQSQSNVQKFRTEASLAIYVLVN